MRSQVESDLLAAGQHRVGHVPVEVQRLCGHLQVLGEGRESLAAAQWPRDQQGDLWSQRFLGGQCLQGFRGCQGDWKIWRSLKFQANRRSWGSRGTLVVLWL